MRERPYLVLAMPWLAPDFLPLHGRKFWPHQREAAPVGRLPVDAARGNFLSARSGNAGRVYR
jgi:hypothetical protein